MFDKNNTAKVHARGLQISTKMSIELCNFVKHKPVAKIMRMLQEIVDMKKPLPITRFNRDLSHKAGMAAGRYPLKATEAFLKLLDSVKSNAENKGLNTDNLVIIHAKADRADARQRYGRKGRVSAKNTHVELVVEEKEIKKVSKKAEKKEVNKK